MRRPLDDDKAEGCDEALPVGNPITADDFFTWLQLVAGEGHANLALVVVDLANDAVRAAERDTLDGVALSFAAASAN